MQRLVKTARMQSREHDSREAGIECVHRSRRRTELHVQAIVVMFAAVHMFQQPQATPPADSAPRGPVVTQPVFLDARRVLATDSAPPSQRPRVVEYTHAYDVRLTIHKY